MALELTFPLSMLAGAGLAAYALLGSTSMGYVLLRSAWPSVRHAQMEYKSGWSLIYGNAIAIGILAMAIGSLFLPQGSGLGEAGAFFSSAAAVSASGIGIFSLRRMLPGSRKMKVTIPKRLVSASVASKMAFEKIPTGFYEKTPVSSPNVVFSP